MNFINIELQKQFTTLNKGVEHQIWCVHIGGQAAYKRALPQTPLLYDFYLWWRH